MQYREYQKKLHQDIYASWAHSTNVIGVLPTGGGKTVVMSGIIRDWTHGKIVAVAHRKELVGQIAMALAVNEVPHSIIGPSSLVRYVVQRQRTKLGTHFHDTNAKVVVASVDTLISPSRQASLQKWRESVGLWIIDECHHVVEGNKWGKAVGLFPNAYGLGFTATPCRADGKGLGRHADGVFDTMVVGPTMRDLINQGFLSDYRIFCPQTYMPIEGGVGASGDYTTQQLKTAAKESQIVGDVIKSYEQHCPGKSAVVFATDVETATDMAHRYNSNGIRAEVVSATTPDVIRTEVLDRFERRDLDVLINVDLLGEGFDCPGIEAVIMARPTESYGLYCQQFGRALRILDGKDNALIIDHVGNVVRHRLPDAPRLWSLDARERRPKPVDSDDDIPLKYCAACTQPYERFRDACPHCGHVDEPETRGRPETVDGDIFEVSPEILAALRGEVAKVDVSPEEMRRRMLASGASEIVAGSVAKNQRLRSDMQRCLRASMQWWAGVQNAAGLSDREAMRKFYLKFGIDIFAAQALGRTEALDLANRINEDLASSRAKHEQQQRRAS